MADFLVNANPQNIARDRLELLLARRGVSLARQTAGRDAVPVRALRRLPAIDRVTRNAW
jgi:hypothetical protein